MVKTALQNEGPITKRHMVRITTSHYDPPGVLSPVSVRFKFLVQKACLLMLSWDAHVNNDLASKWKQLISYCEKLPSFVIDQNYLHGRNLHDVSEMELHGFSDASGKAYACVIYLRILF